MLKCGRRKEKFSFVIFSSFSEVNKMVIRMSWGWWKDGHMRGIMKKGIPFKKKENVISGLRTSLFGILPVLLPLCLAVFIYFLRKRSWWEENFWGFEEVRENFRFPGIYVCKNLGNISIIKFLAGEAKEPLINFNPGILFSRGIFYN